MSQVFINEAFTKAVKNYLDTKNQPESIVFNSFLVVFLRQLVNIYSELDIINPVMMGSVEALRSNLTKYSYLETNVNKLLAELQNYYDVEHSLNSEENIHFINIQKMLIDMFITKRLNYKVTDEEIKEFYNLLYTPNSSNNQIVLYNKSMVKDVDEIDRYFKQKMQENIKIEPINSRVLLNVQAYEIVGYNLEKINTMSNEEITILNHKIYDFFKIRENAINKEYLLEKAIEEFKNEKEPLTTGNGYVDILLIMSIISTIIMIGVIIKFLVIK